MRVLPLYLLLQDKVADFMIWNSQTLLGVFAHQNAIL